MHDAAVMNEVLGIARDAGFAFAGIADARPSDHAEAIRRWVAEGKHGSMAWFADDLEVRIDPARLLTGARSVLCVADRYALPKRDPRSEVWPPRGRIARYARGDDYHVWIRKRLRRLAARLRERFPSEEFRIACDLLPVLERELAARAGLGGIGKHTLLLRPGEGSYFLLGEVITTLDLPMAPTAGAADPCGGCTRCIDACPTAAISPYSVDASRCLSYTTIEHRGPIDSSFHRPTADWLFGCDICQEVCPHNQPTRRRAKAAVDEHYRERMVDLDLFEVLGWSEADRLNATMRSALRRAQLSMLKRNAIICLANALAKREDPGLRARLVAISQDPSEDDLVRETARQVCC
ncbi:MAG: tRNA epoxyqueuosine(34) reductase QueG [Phycisphaerae bacterium]|nr:tRNA epoxyqueuosine(34) reductase QueG [Phycisphaerae bacterium]